MDRKIRSVFFDLDGLLVDTEPLHWQAYRRMCASFDCHLPWDLKTYEGVAGGGELQTALYELFPKLAQRSWDELYALKEELFFTIVEEESIPCMPGALLALEYCQMEKIPVAVVTNSRERFVQRIKDLAPVFQHIECWVFREMYEKAKPAPDGYLLAAKYFDISPEDAIGFDDAHRGIESLLAAGCQPVLVNAKNEALQHFCRSKKIPVLTSLEYFEDLIRERLCDDCCCRTI